MYSLEYLPLARRDMVEIASYIGQELKNPDAAERLAVNLSDAAEGILIFPYAWLVYVPLRPLKHEYRKVAVQNYLIFYWVDEEQKKVTVARIVYARRNYGRMSEDKGELPVGDDLC